MFDAEAIGRPGETGVSDAVDPSNVKTTFPVRVTALTREAEDIVSFELVHPDGAALPQFTAGSHIDVADAPAFTAALAELLTK